jgi:hypothetical protein
VSPLWLGLTVKFIVLFDKSIHYPQSVL